MYKMSYYTGSISTGKLTATTVYVYPDTSNSIAAGLQAVEVNTGSLTANTVNATVFNFGQANLDVSNNLTVGGNTLLNNLHVTGTVQLDNLVIDSSNSFFNAMTATTGNIGTLNVSGNSNLKATDVSGNLGVRGIANLKGTNVAGVLDVSGNLGVRGTTNLAGTNVVGTLAVTGSETVSGTLGVTGVSNLAGTNVVGTLAVTGSETVSGTLGVTGVSNLAGTNVVGTLAVTGSETVSGSVAAGSLSVAGTTVDVSGNLIVVGTTSVKSLNVNGTGYVSGAVTLADNLAVLANEYLGGNMYANKGLTVGDSSNGTGVALSVAPGTTVLAVTGSETLTGSVSAASLSATGAVSGGSLSIAGTTVDVSGNLVVVGTTTVESLLANGTASFDESVNVTGNESVQGGFYTDGGAYINNNFVVGDGSDNDGVTMHTTGTTLNIFGVTQDSSATAFPIKLNVVGDVTVGTHFNTTTPTVAPTVIDSSNVTGTPTITGSDLAGLISFQPDTLNPPYITIAFGVNYTNAPIVMISPANVYAATGGDLGYVSNVTSSGFTLNITGNGTSNTYGFNYFVIGK